MTRRFSTQKTAVRANRVASAVIVAVTKHAAARLLCDAACNILCAVLAQQVCVEPALTAGVEGAVGAVMRCHPPDIPICKLVISVVFQMTRHADSAHGAEPEEAALGCS